jgi:polyhydroxybutyrate depolymerase
MRGKIIGLFVCILLITTCAVQVCFTVSASNVKKSSVSPGDYVRFMVFDMRLRSYRIHIPSSYDGSKPMPLVFVLHGFPSNAKQIELVTGMDAKADEEGFIVVYPNGEVLSLKNEFWCLILLGYWGLYFNCWDFDNVDDVGYIRTLIENLQTTLDINSSRIYITGWSGGGFMTYRLGAELSNIVAAIAPVCGSIGGKWTSSSPFYMIPTPEQSVPVIIFHGMNDSNVPYNGGGWCFSVNQSVSFWVQCDNCNPTPQINISNSGNIIRKTYANRTNGTEVVLYTVVDGVHAWFGSPYFPCEISATDLIWNFFAAHPKR